MDGYRELIDRVHDCIDRHVPHGSVVLIASKGDDRLTRACRASRLALSARCGRAVRRPLSRPQRRGAHAPPATLREGRAIPLSSRGRRTGGSITTASSRRISSASHELIVSQDGDVRHLRAARVVRLRCVRTAVRTVRAIARRWRRQGWRWRWRSRWTRADRADHADAAAADRPPRAARPDDSGAVRDGAVSRPPNARSPRLFGRQMPAVDRDVLVVDNARPRHAVEERADGTTVIGGDNSAREFSAFDRAIEFVGSRIWSYDLVHFATSAFNRLYVAYLERFDTRLLEALAGRAVCVGHIDCYNEPVDVLTYRSQHWIRSCFFFMPPAEVRALGSFVSVTRSGAVLQRRSRRAVPRGCADQPSLSRIHHPLADRRRHRPGRRVALEVRADARDAAGVRAEDARDSERAAARHPAARDGLPRGRRHVAVGHAAASRAARHRVEHAVAGTARQSGPRRGRAAGAAARPAGGDSSWTPSGRGGRRLRHGRDGAAHRQHATPSLAMASRRSRSAE